jgi:hypothetical protein
MIADGGHVEALCQHGDVLADEHLPADVENVQEALVDQPDHAVAGAEDEPVGDVLGENQEALRDLLRVLTRPHDEKHHNKQAEEETTEPDDPRRLGDVRVGDELGPPCRPDRSGS